MRKNLHEDARQMIIFGDEKLALKDRQWLCEHLDSCGQCQHYAAILGDLGTALRARSCLTDSTLLQKTALRVRHGARGWHQRQARLRFLWRSTLAMLILVFSSLRVSWGVFTHAQIHFRYAYTTFIYFWIIPTIVTAIAILAASVFLSKEDPILLEARQ